MATEFWLAGLFTLVSPRKKTELDATRAEQVKQEQVNIPSTYKEINKGFFVSSFLESDARLATPQLHSINNRFWSQLVFFWQGNRNLSVESRKFLYKNNDIFSSYFLRWWHNVSMWHFTDVKIYLSYNGRLYTRGRIIQPNSNTSDQALKCCKY